MREYRLPLALALAASFSLTGCANFRPESSASAERPASPEATASSATAADAEKPAVPAGEKPEVAAAPAESEPVAAPTPPHDLQATPSERLAEQLRDATRELATLRASNAKLRTAAAKPVAPVVMREPEPVDAKLTASLRSYVQFKQELAGFFADLEKLRTENGTLSAELKDVAAGSKEAKAELAKLEGELRFEKEARAQAEQTITKLREQLRAVADAVTAAGLSFDRAASGSGATARLETSAARLRAAAEARRHVVKEGESLETIADRYYGDRTKWKIILEANRQRLPLDGAMPVGLELEIPAK